MHRPIFRSAVGMGIPMEIPMGHGYGYGVGMGIEIPSPRQPCLFCFQDIAMHIDVANFT